MKLDKKVIILGYVVMTHHGYMKKETVPGNMLTLHFIQKKSKKSEPDKSEKNVFGYVPLTVHSIL